MCSFCSASGTDAFGRKFLGDVKQHTGVVSRASGLMYKVLRAGDGQDSPTAESPCECHYEGRVASQYPNGEKFDSSYDRGSPSTFAPSQVIRGWTEALQLMVEGDKWELYIPSELAYGDEGHPPSIGGGNALIFTIELLKIKGEKKPAVRCDVKTLAGCNERETRYIATSRAKLLKPDASTADNKEAVEEELKRLKGQRDDKGMLPPQKQWLMVRIKILTGLQKEAWLAWIREGDEALAPVPYRPGVSLTSPAARRSSRGALSWLPASVCVLATLGLLACRLCGR